VGLSDEGTPNPPVRRTRAMRRVRNQVVKRVQKVEKQARQSSRKRVRASLYVWRLCVQVIGQWNRDHCPQQAAGLSFQSVLSVVPALALTMAAFRFTGAMGAESSLVKFLSSEFLPLSADEISEKLLGLSENINFEAMGIVGLASTLFIAFLTFNSLEQSINRIWRVEKRRSLPRRLLTFYVSIIAGSIMVGLSLYQAAEFGLTDGWSGAVFSVLIAFCGIFLANYFLPATRVRVGAALVGTAVTTVASELAKIGFASYVTGFAMDRYSGIYGSLAVVPLCLIWIYWSCLMLLFGIEVSHSVQNLRLLESGPEYERTSLADELSRCINGPVGAQVLAAVASTRQDEEAGLSRFALAQRFSLSDDAIRIITNRLRDSQLLREPTSNDLWTLARPADSISVREVFAAFRNTENGAGEAATNAGDNAESSHANALLQRIAAEQQNVADEYSIADLCDPVE